MPRSSSFWQSGNLVQGKLRLARLVSKDGAQWKVQYLGGKTEEMVAKAKVRQLFGAEPEPAKKKKKRAAAG